MTLVSPKTLDRDALLSWYANNRSRTAQLLGFVSPSAYADRPIPLRHPILFYDGHIPAFSYIKLVREALGRAPLDLDAETLFARGIDPDSQSEAERAAPQAWPSRERIATLRAGWDAAVIDALRNAPLDDGANPMRVRGEVAYTILEHEAMHQETLLYILNRLPLADLGSPLHTSVADPQPPDPRVVTIPAGLATLGVDPGTVPFSWDNERGEHQVAVDAFAIDAYPVTNSDWMHFVRQGGPLPPFWVERDGEYALRTLFGEVTLPRSWPVYVSNEMARAYAAHHGGRLPTEAEYHRAAFGTPQGTERPYPWGDAKPDSAHGNFGFRRWDPEPIGASPAGASAWDVHELVGNGWEWTSTVFAPFAGFTPHASYPVYSSDFFDGKHVVMKGASPVTHTALIRRSWRNWYRADYPYTYAKFRLVRG